MRVGDWELRVSGFRFRVSGLGFRVSGGGFGVWGLGFGAWGLGFGVSGFGFRVSGFSFSLQASAQVLGFRLKPNGVEGVPARSRPKPRSSAASSRAPVHKHVLLVITSFLLAIS